MRRRWVRVGVGKGFWLRDLGEIRCGDGVRVDIVAVHVVDMILTDDG